MGKQREQWLARQFKRVNWRQFTQSIMDGAGNTVGTVAIYAIIVLGVFLWYKQNKKGNKNKDEQNHKGENGSDFLTTALSFSKPAAAMRNANNAEGGLFGTSANTEGGWI